MIALYIPGHSVLHRAPASLKLLFLIAGALIISLYPHDVWSVGITFAVVVLLFGCAGFGPRVFWRQLWLTRWIVLLVAVSQLLFLTPTDALVNTVRMVSIVLLAALLTLTTRSEDLLSTLERGLTPLRRVGVDPRRVSLTLSLAISMIPVVADIATRVRDAQRARGARMGFGIVVPILVISLRHADEVADALSARGIE